MVSRQLLGRGGSTVFGSKNKICFLALFSHTDGICGGNCDIKDVKKPMEPVMAYLIW